MNSILTAKLSMAVKAGFLYSIAPIVREKAKTLDCYAAAKQDLRSIYERVLGFKTASVMDYNMEYDHDNIAENNGNPQVAFMVNTDSDVETKHFTKDQYDEAKEYRDGFVKSESADSSESASFVPENGFIGEDSGMQYSVEQADLLSRFSVEAIQNAFDYYYSMLFLLKHIPIREKERVEKIRS